MRVLRSATELILATVPLMIAASLSVAAPAAGPRPPVEAPSDVTFSNDQFNVATFRDGVLTALTDSNRDFKPVSSPDGRTLVFFRVRTYGDGSFETWRTSLCVINVDGSGFRELTSGEYADYNPTFMRDGTGRIVFNRYNRTGGRESEIYITTPDAEQGGEQRVSHPTSPAYEWVYSTLKDGRLFVHRITGGDRGVFLLTPRPGELGSYERVEMPSDQYFHKACISPSETKITYMYDNDNNGATYNDAQIAFARFDAESLRVYDQELITPNSPDTIEEYPKWSPDETMVLYDSNKANGGGAIYQIYAYRLSDGEEQVISSDPEKNHQFVCVIGLPK